MGKKRSKDLGDLGGMVYSTDSSFDYDDDIIEEAVVENHKQRLKVFTDKKQRKGKVVTLIEGFEGPDIQLVTLSKSLKTLCGTGGSVKDRIILIQGDFKKKIAEYLQKEEYNVKILG